MKIVKLKAQNIKNLKAVEITPDGNVIRLTGKNGAGKSAVLDTIFTTLTGNKLEDPIRHDQERAEVVIDMGEFKVRKVWTAKGQRLEVTTANGDSKKSPQTFLNDLIGKLSFDPLAFKGMKATDQRDLLKDLVKLNFDDITSERQKVYDDRTALNVRIKGKLAELKNIEAPHPNTPDEEISYKEELDKINQLRQKREIYVQAVRQAEGFLDSISGCNKLIGIKNEEMKRLQDEIDAMTKKRDDFQRVADNYVIPQEVTANQVQEAEFELEEISKKNVAIRAAARYRTLLKEGDKLNKEADLLTERLGRIEQDKSTRIANAQFPIEGLSMNDDSVIYAGIPFNRLSTGQQIRVSTAIAMKLNPTLKTIFIREGSLLDEAGKKEIFDLATDSDYQVWMEEVDETGQVGFFIEDGANTKIDGKDVAQPLEEKEKEEIKEPQIQDEGMTIDG